MGKNDRKPLIAKSTLTEKEEALQKVMEVNQTGDNNDDKTEHKYNIAIPHDLFIEIKDFIKENGYNLKGFFLSSAKEKMKREGK